MSFNFISETEAIARQTLPGAIVFFTLGIIAIIYYFSKDKGAAYLIVGCVLLAVGGWYGYQAKLLKENPGVWEISVINDTIEWNSPNQKIDKSFTMPLSNINHIRIEKYDGELKLPTEYFLVTDDQSIPLNPVSGINLEEFAEYLARNGVSKNEVLVEKNK